MRFEGAGHTDVGRVKENNQDAYLIKIAETGSLGDVALVAVADGMGGLSKGELASATVIRALSEWFDQDLSRFLETMDPAMSGFSQFIEDQWDDLVQTLNQMIMRYGMIDQVNLGTTLTAFLAIGSCYSIVHVGDSRAYEISDQKAVQLTEDQTFVKREIDAGRMTSEEALTHPQRNVLLQCIGASKNVKPTIIHGDIDKDATYLLCSDGFRHVLTDDDLRDRFSPRALSEFQRGVEIRSLLDDVERRPGKNADSSQKIIARCLEDATNLVKERKERDNITAVALIAEGPF